MTAFIFANDINTQLAGAISSSSTSITLASSLNLPASIPTGYNLVITLRDAATRQNTEIVYATAITGTTLTVVRGQDGTTAQAWAVGDYAYSGPTADQMSNLQSGRLLAVQVFSASGTYTPTTGTTKCRVRAIGGGGGGGGCASTTSGQCAVGGGGSAGAYAETFIANPVSQTVTIGVGGSAGSSAGGNGGTGGTTSFGSLIVLPGGLGGALGTPATPPILNSSASATSGGTVSGTPLVRMSGVSGPPGIALSTSQVTGGGGGSSPLATGQARSIGAGANGQANGAGGSGAGNGGSSAGNAGGTGAAGLVIVEDYA